MINTIIFDFDGTLVNTNDVIIEAWQHTYRHYGRDEKPVDYITQFFGEPLITTMAREFPEVLPEESAPTGATSPSPHHPARPPDQR